jgi:hypothetical protein
MTLSLLPNALDLIAPDERVKLRLRLISDPWAGQYTPASCPTRHDAIRAFWRAIGHTGGMLGAARLVDEVRGNTPETMGRPRRLKKQWWYPFDRMIELPYCYLEVRSYLMGYTLRRGWQRWGIRYGKLQSYAQALDVPVEVVAKHREWIMQVPAAKLTMRPRRQRRPKWRSEGDLPTRVGVGPNGGVVALSRRRIP